MAQGRRCSPLDDPLTVSMPVGGANKCILQAKLNRNQERAGEAAPDLPNRRITAAAGVTTPDIVVKLEPGDLLNTTYRDLINLEHLIEA